MKKHYSLTEEAYKKLCDKKITDLDLIKYLILFDPYNKGEQLGILNLLHYIDKFPDFISPEKDHVHKLIARCLFESLDLNPEEKLMIYEYCEDSLDG